MSEEIKNSLLDDEMKVITFQVAIFCKDMIDNPELFANELNSQLGKNSFAVFESHTIKIPTDVMSGNLPIYEMRTENGDCQFVISQGRCDLTFSPDLLSQSCISNVVQACHQNAIDFMRVFLNKKNDVYRMGLVLSVFKKQKGPGQFVYSQYFGKTKENVKEAFFRINIGEELGTIQLNNVLTISDGKVENKEQDISEEGAILIRDINNVPVDNKFLSFKDIKTIMSYALRNFTDKRIVEV